MADPDDAVDGEPSQSSHSQSHNVPSIAAAFLVEFDNRKGYTLAWSETANDLDIEGVVEFKSLPSGLHKVKEDLVYFTHEHYAGVSAFLNRQDDQDARNARMLAVGVMVPIERGRMGKSWLHADALKNLAQQQIENQEDYTLLKSYWNDHKIVDSDDQEDTPETEPEQQPDLKIDTTAKALGYRRSRAMSLGLVAPGGGHTLSPDHPAAALMDLLHTFGPLLFPLYRATLLRKRILLLGEAPVARTCSFVYNLSILSALPRDVITSLPLEDTSDVRLVSLFNVGISDIPLLEQYRSGPGWIACTTDDVLCTKPDLFDLLVVMPTVDSLPDSPRRYPKIVLSSPELSKAFPKYGVRASQRDVRRYVTLWRGLKAVTASLSIAQEQAVEEEDDKSDNVSVASSASSSFSRTSIIEPQSWSRIAYTSLIWWASAGDKRAGLAEAEENEFDQDSTLLDTQLPGEEGLLGSGMQEEPEARTKEVVVVTYFHRLTALIFQILGDANRRMSGGPDDDDNYDQQPYRDDEGEDRQPTSNDHDRDDDRQELLPSTSNDNTLKQKAHSREQDTTVQITQEDLVSMGLQTWSSSDQKFVEEMVQFWYGKEGIVQGGKIECCGLRIL